MEPNGVILLGGCLLGTAVGVLTGIFGVGGGFLLTPALMIILGVPGATAVGTGLAVILVTSSFGLLKRCKTGTVDLKLALMIGAGSLLGVIAGQRLMELLEGITVTILGREQPGAEYVLLWCFVVMLAFIGVFLHVDYRRNRGQAPAKRVGWLTKISLGPRMEFKSLEEPRLSVVPLILLGGGVGILTGLLGVGGGVLLLPALVYLVGQRTVKAAGTSLVLVWLSSATGVVLYARSGNVALALWVAMLIGGLVGTHFGTQLGLKIGGPKIRLGFVYVVAGALVMVGYKLFVMTVG